MDFNSKVIFLHVPKAGRTTLLRIFEKKYAKEERFHFFVTAVEKTRSSYNRQEFDEVYRNVLAHLMGMGEAERSRIKLLHGHVPYGVHQFLDGKVQYIAVLRDPIDRVVSHYYYAMQKTGTYLYEKVADEGLAYDDYGYLEAFLGQDQAFMLENFQTALLAGIDVPEPLDYEKVIFFRMPTFADLERAKRHLDKCAVVGLSERMDETLLLMQQALGWAHFPYYENANVTARRPKLSEIPKHTLRVIERHNELDCELYEYAKKKFEQSVERDLLPLLAASRSAPARGGKRAGRAAGGETGLELFLLQNKLDGAKQEILRLRAGMETQANEVKRLQGELQAARRETASVLAKMDQQKHEYQARLGRFEKFEKSVLEPAKKNSPILLGLDGRGEAGRRPMTSAKILCHCVTARNACPERSVGKAVSWVAGLLRCRFAPPRNDRQVWLRNKFRVTLLIEELTDVASVYL